MKHLVLISGKMFSGKSTAARALPEYEPCRFAAPIYSDIAKLGFTAAQVNEKSPEIRKLFQVIGDARRKFDPFYYADQMFHRLDKVGGSFPEYARVDDLRFQTEIIAALVWARKNKCEITLIRIERPGFDRPAPEHQHISETDLDFFTGWDHVLTVNEDDIGYLRTEISGIVSRCGV